MSPVVDPFAGGCDPLACRDRRGMPDRRHEIAMAARFDTQHAKAVLGVVISDAFDHARQHFLRRFSRLRQHGVRYCFCGDHPRVLTQQSRPVGLILRAKNLLATGLGPAAKWSGDYRGMRLLGTARTGTSVGSLRTIGPKTKSEWLRSFPPRLSL